MLIRLLGALKNTRTHSTADLHQRAARRENETHLILHHLLILSLVEAQKADGLFCQAVWLCVNGGQTEWQTSCRVPLDGHELRWWDMNYVAGQKKPFPSSVMLNKSTCCEEIRSFLLLFNSHSPTYSDVAAHLGFFIRLTFFLQSHFYIILMKYIVVQKYGHSHFYAVSNTDLSLYNSSHRVISVKVKTTSAYSFQEFCLQRAPVFYLPVT